MINYSDIISDVSQLISYGCGLGLTFAICEWAVKFFLDLATDRIRSRR